MNQRIEDEISRRKELEKQHAQRLHGWSKGESHGPFKLMYFPTNICNMKCSICWQRKGVHDFTELSPERQVHLIEEAINLGVRELVIGGGGEPLVRWHQLRPLFERALEAGVHCMMFTNGTLITQEIAQELIQMQLNKVLVSLDGLQPANDEVRQVGSFEKAIRGLKHLLNARGQNSLPLIGVGGVMTRKGIHDLPNFLHFLGGLGCDQFNLIRLVVYTEEQRHFAILPSELKEFEHIISLAQKEASKAGMVTNLADYLDSSFVAQSESFENVLQSDATIAQGNDKFWNSLCFEPFSNLVIHSNGMAGPCCMSGDDPVESVVDRSLTEIWNGKEFNRLRKGILSRRPEPYCRICDLNVFAENQRLRKIGTEGRQVRQNQET